MATSAQEKVNNNMNTRPKFETGVEMINMYE